MTKILTLKEIEERLQRMNLRLVRSERGIEEEKVEVEEGSPSLGR